MNDTNDTVDMLLVEDNAEDADLTLRALDVHGLARGVLVLKNGAEALDYFFAAGRFRGRDVRSAPKVVLLDLKLPKVGGLDVLRRLKSDERTRMIPVVVLSSSREERDVFESYRLGANSYLVKTLDFDQFVHCVSRLGVYWLHCNEAPPPWDRWQKEP